MNELMREQQIAAENDFSNFSDEKVVDDIIQQNFDMSFFIAENSK